MFYLEFYLNLFSLFTIAEYFDLETLNFKLSDDLPQINNAPQTICLMLILG